MRERAAQSMKGGVRQFAHVKPDRFIDIQHAIGVLASEDFMAQLAELLRSQLTNTDLCGRFGGNGILVMLERGTAKDVETWAENVVKRVHEHVFVQRRQDPVGHGHGGSGAAAARQPRRGAGHYRRRQRHAPRAGTRRQPNVRRRQVGHRYRACRPTTRFGSSTSRARLMENRFRLVQQPIASLLGEDKGMFDVLVRMLDEQGNEVLPAEFIAAAERNDLMKNIDRWVIGASMSFAANRKAACIFVRAVEGHGARQELARPGSSTQLKSLKIEPKRMCIQVTEELANQYVRQTKELAENLRKLGFRFALEHFGTGRDPLEAARTTSR